MKNIISSIVYSQLRSKLLIRIYILFIAVMAFTTVMNMDDGENTLHTGELMMGGASLTYVFNFFILAMAVGIIFCEDFKDKTANYEIMRGYSRLKIYLSRGLFAMVTASLMTLLLSFVPLIAGNIAYGWGDMPDLGDFIVRVLLYFFPFMRVAAFLTILSVIIRNQYVIMGIGYFAMDYIIIRSGTDGECSVLRGLITGFDSVIYLTKYDSNLSHLSLKGGMLTVAVSVVMSAVYLFIGYRVFKRRDI